MGVAGEGNDLGFSRHRILFSHRRAHFFGLISPAPSKVARLLEYTPLRRVTVFDAMADPYFDPLREPGATLSDGSPLPPLFNFSESGTDVVNRTMISRVFRHLSR